MINTSRNIKLKSQLDLVNIIPGQDNSFNVTIENLGNRVSNFILTYSGLPTNSGLEKYVKLEYTSILLGPYMEFDLGITINVPKNFSIDSNQNTSGIEGYSLQIEIEDQNSTENKNSLIIDVQINQFQDFELEKDKLTGYIVRNSTVGTVFNVNIFNSGNYQDEIEFNMEPPHISDPPWIIIPYKLTLPYNNFVNLTIDVEPRSFESRVGTYIFVLNCSSAQNPLTFKYLELIVKVIDYDLKISEVAVDGKTMKFLKTFEGTKLKFSFDLSIEFTELDITKYPLPPHLDFRNRPVTIKIFDNGEEVINGTMTVRFMNGTIEQRISLYWLANSLGVHNIKIFVDPANEIPENYENNNVQEIIIQVNTPSISSESGNGQGIVLNIQSGMITLSALILLIAGAFVGGTEVGKFKFLVGLLPLYTRLKRDKILDHETRGMIRGYIIANPGVHFNYLKRELKLKNGSLAYHLKVLERGEFIKIEREGMYTRLYPMQNGAYYKGAFKGVRLSEIQKKIVRQVRIKPGITQKKIIAQTGIKQQTVSRNISALEEKEVIRVKRKGRETYCYFNKEIELKDN
jgi:predicted transcriptional regulator